MPDRNLPRLATLVLAAVATLPNQLLLHTSCHRAFTTLADTPHLPNWFVLTKDVTLEGPPPSPRARFSASRSSTPPSKAASPSSSPTPA